MLNVIYHFELNHQILNNLVCIGKYDGVNPSICFVTVGGKIMIFSPYEKIGSLNQDLRNDVDYKILMNSSLKKELNILNLNKEISAISFGIGDTISPKEYLFIGSPTSLMCYDIAGNKTLFNNELLNGVYCMATGVFSKFNYPLCIVGGNFLIQGFDLNGEEKFSTFAGGNAICMGMSDFDDDSFLELIVGTDDYSIRIYKDEKSSLEINENTKIVLIHPYENTKFVYGLDNGTVGLYERGEKFWKKKQKGILNSVLCIDINHDGIAEIICGLSTGKLQIRNEQKGDILYEFELKFSISKILFGDLNNSGFEQIICCTENGEIFGYVTQDNPNIIDNSISTKEKTSQREEIAKYEKLLSEKKVIMRNF
jgi:Bardet-Biedl syndrome 2 protein